jgi:hypothetical protein
VPFETLPNNVAKTVVSINSSGIAHWASLDPGEALAAKDMIWVGITVASNLDLFLEKLEAELGLLGGS